MTDTYPHKSQSPGGNHPRTSTLGGASAVPTAANNSGGGTGWGDKGFFKGGSHESGHTNKTTKAQSTIGGFLALQEQKGVAEGNYEERAENMNLSDDPTTLKGTCETEDHSFMGHRPGHSHTLPGWSLTKEAVEATLHGQGR